MATARAFAEDTDAQIVEVEETMQVNVLNDDGVALWHRWLPGSNGSETACGFPVDAALTLGLRNEQCLGDMCPDCFTLRELGRAMVANSAARRK